MTQNVVRLYLGKIFKMAKTQYEDGALLLGNFAEKLKSQLKPMAEQEFANITQGQSPEQIQDAKDSAGVILETTQQELAKTPEAEHANFAAKKEQIIKERAEAQGRGLSSGERIALAILSAAPMIAAATNAQSDPYAASKASGQIRQGFIDSNDAANKAAVAQKDVELEQLNMDEKNALSQKDKAEERKYQEGRDQAKFQHDFAIESMKSKGSAMNDPIKADKVHRDIASSIIKSNPKAFEASKQALFNAEKLNDVANGAGSLGFNDIQMIYSFVSGLDNSVVRESDMKNFNAAKGILANLRNKPNAVLNGQQLGPEGRAAILALQRTMARSASKTLNNAVSPKQISHWKQKFGDSLDPDYVKSLVTGNQTPYQQQIMNEAQQQDELDELQRLSAKRDGAKK